MKLWSIKINGESIKTAEDLAVKLFVEKHRIGEFLFGNPGEPLKHWIITFLPASVSRSENGTRFALEAQVLYQRTQMRINKEYLEDVEISCEEISGPQPFDVIITFGNFEEIKTEEPKQNDLPIFGLIFKEIETEELEQYKDLKTLIDEVTGINNDARRDRPYNGQPHTDEGERGKTLVKGLTMRDVADCMAMGLLEASGIPELQDVVERGTWIYADLYKLDDFDPVAAIQCMACRLEKMMGIYPNVPKLIFEDDSEDI